MLHTLTTRISVAMNYTELLSDYLTAVVDDIRRAEAEAEPGADRAAVHAAWGHTRVAAEALVLSVAAGLRAARERVEAIGKEVVS